MVVALRRLRMSLRLQKEKGPLYELLLPFEREIVLGTGYKEPLTLLEDMMAQLYPIEIVLRLLALVSLANQVNLFFRLLLSEKKYFDSFQSVYSYGHLL